MGSDNCSENDDWEFFNSAEDNYLQILQTRKNKLEGIVHSLEKNKRGIQEFISSNNRNLSQKEESKESSSEPDIITFIQSAIPNHNKKCTEFITKQENDSGFNSALYKYYTKYFETKEIKDSFENLKKIKDAY